MCYFVTAVYLSSDPVPEKVFRGMMKAQTTPVSDPTEYKERISLVFRRSELGTSFLITEILALDRWIYFVIIFYYKNTYIRFIKWKFEGYRKKCVVTFRALLPCQSQEWHSILFIIIYLFINISQVFMKRVYILHIKWLRIKSK